MQSAVKGSYTYSYTYNSDGLRTQKRYAATYNSSGHYDYTWSDDGKLTSLSWYSNWGESGSMLFYYDAQGNPAFVDYVDEYGYTTGRYEYILNLQGDVVALYCPTLKTNVVTYTYDAWGKVLGFTALDSGYAGLMGYNPLRYRGYCYDEDTGFYYLQSRYYDQTVGRFLNADDTAYLGASGTLLSCNLYAYCENNPLNNDDPTGHSPFLAIGLQLVINVGRLTVGLEALWSTSNWKFYLFGFVGGSKSFNIKSLTQTENALMEDAMYLMRSVKKFSISSFSIFKKLSISVSFIAVLGNRYASFPADYCGWFTGVSLTFWHITVSGAIGYSGKIEIGSLGLGVSSSKASVGFGQTFYFQLTGNNAFRNSIEALKNGIKNKLSVLKLFACFF